MADDLAALSQQLGGFEDEEAIRLDVVARVVSQSSRAALEDDERVKKCWRELERAERVVNDLQIELNEAQLEAAQLASGIQRDARADPTEVAPSARSISTIRFELNAAERELKRADAAVRQVQRDVDRRQVERHAEAKRQEQDELIAERDAATARTRAAKEEMGGAPPLRTTNVGYRRGGSVPLPVALPRSATAGVPSLGQGDSRRNGGGGGSSSSGHPDGGPSSAATTATTTTTRVLYRAPHHLRGVTRSDYSGGDVLPSLSRVQVTRADIRAKQRRYQDDSEMDVYLERMAKRQQLEAVANQQRRFAVAGNRSAASRSSVASSHVVPTASHVKVEEHVSGAVASLVKREPNVAVSDAPIGVSSHGTTKMEWEEVQDGDDDEDDVIDVDALMEDDDDTAVAAAVQLAATRLTNAQARSSDHNVTPPLSQGFPQSQLLSPDAVSQDSSMVMEVEEVTLLPGVRMDATIYHKLLDYQQEGLLWLLTLHAHRSGGILGDEMGLGKTIQVAALINALHHSHLLRGPVLIVAPMTVLRQWLAELHRWAPYVRSCVLHESSGSEATRESLLTSLQGSPAVVITTYATMRVHCDLLHHTGFQYLILDEGHKISNPETGVTLAAKSFTTPHRLILSGSPIQNSLRELWCLFDFVQPGLLGTLHRFTDEFEAPIAQSRNLRASPLALATAIECAKTLQAHIAPYLLRRLKRQVIASLPPKYERVLRVPLTDQQLDQYLQVLSSPAVQRLFAQTVMYGSRYGGLDRDGRDSAGSLHVAGPRANMASRRNNSGLRLESFRLMNQLRQICNHADIYAVQRGADEEDRMLVARHGATAGSNTAQRGKYRSFRSNNPVNLGGSGKLEALLMMLKEWKRFGHRVLVFSQTRMMLDIIENVCEQLSYTYIRMDGATNSHHRQELMDRFNEDDSIFLALLTTRVGGIGVNLVGANRVVIFDPDWNPITDIQARERAWRIGQHREVCVYRLITSGSVEEAILRRQLAKMYVTDKVLKDPELQRFFHVQDGFMDNFLLGAEYASRVPPGKRYLLAAQRAPGPPAHSRKSARTAGGGEDARQRWEHDNAVPGVDEDEDEGSDENSLPDRHDPVLSRTVSHEGDVTCTSRSAREEREFGLLVPVKHEGEIDPADPSEVDGGVAAETGQRGKEAWRETQLLQDLVDRRDISVAGHDRVAHHLARKKAEDMLRRVAASTDVAVEAIRQQQQQYSLLHALEEKKTKDAADRAEAGQYFREETLNKDAASTRRKRRRDG